MKNTYKEFDHSGDVGIEARGATLTQVLENAALGLFSLMVSGDVRRQTERRISVRSDSEENLLVDWLSEVIGSASVNGEVYGSVEVRSTGPNSIEAVLGGEPADNETVRLRFEVKAATYHGLVFRRSGEGWYARVIFDL